MDRVLPDLSGKSYLGAKILSRSCLGQGGARKEEEEVREARAEDGLRPSGRPGGVWQRRVDSWGLGELTVKARHAQRAQLSLGWYSGLWFLIVPVALKNVVATGLFVCMCT